jgi:Transglycosylase SLT domain
VKRVTRVRRGGWLPVLAVTAAVTAGCVHSPAPGRPRAVHSTAVPAPGASSTPAGSHDPASYAAPVRRYAASAGIDAQLLMAILYNEAYKPHDPTLERAWQRLHPDAAFGVANMHRSAFDDAKRGRDFADRDWTELPDDPDLAIEAAAWYLHDLARQLPASWPGRYTKDELLALGYNAGPGGMTSFAQGGKPGAVAQGYLDRLHANWDAAGRALG